VMAKASPGLTIQRFPDGEDDTSRIERGGTLPYREATSLVDCIEIMGEANAANCRQQVLGETSPAIPATPAAPTPAPVVATCAPTALSRPNFLSRTGSTDFGLTALDTALVTYPEFRLSRVSRGRYRVLSTTAALPTIPSFYTGAGTFTEGQAISGGRNGCPQRRYPVRWTIYPSGATKLGEGEQEHCNDFQYAFDISLRRYAAAVNQLAQIRRPLRRRTLERRLVRDRLRWHTPNPSNIFPHLSRNNCAYVGQIITGRSLRHVGRHSSNSVVVVPQASPAVQPRRRRRGGPGN
jgi:hypothetical protein